MVEDDRFATPVDIVGRPESKIRHVRQIQLVYPLTGQGKLAFFGLSTECLRDWDEYVEMMAQISKTISWMETSGDSSIGAVLEG